MQIKKIIKFFKNYFLKDPVFVLYYIWAYKQKEFSNKALFYTEQEFFAKIHEGKSIIRIGDGEIGLLHGRDIHYQKHTKELQVGLKEIIETYSPTSPYVLSIPIFVNYSNSELAKTNGKLTCWLPLKVEFRRMFDKKAQYADAHFFYYRDFMLRFFKEFLENKHVIFISNSETNTKIRATKTVFTSTQYVDTPSDNSFQSIHDIIRDIDKALDTHSQIHSNEPVTLAISTGPTSKLLVKKYADLGYQGFDIGFGLRYLYDEKDYSHVI